jgi:hypothetical protein
MPDYDKRKIDDLIAVGLDRTRVTKERGDALEELFCYLLCELPGIVVRRNTRDPMRSKEIDITVANAHEARWLKLYPTAFLVECKNWDEPVAAKVVADFILKLEESFVAAGILVAANGITGNANSRTSAYQRIAMAQQQGRRVVVIIMDQIKAVQTTDDFEALLRDEFMKVVGSDGF